MSNKKMVWDFRKLVASYWIRRTDFSEKKLAVHIGGFGFRRKLELTALCF